MKRLEPLKLLTLLLVTLLISSCDLSKRIEHRSKIINNYEKKSLNLARNNRALKAQVNNLKFEIKSLTARNNFLKIKLDKFEGKKKKRALASVKKYHFKSDQVQFDIYRWSPEQLIAIAEIEFAKKNYEKSAQFFYILVNEYPQNKLISDRVYFQLGVAAYESGNHYDWAEKYLGKLISKYPASSYFRGAKLWRGLTYEKQGKGKAFFKVIEEFRLKYRNTAEWKILHGHYNEIRHKYKM